ncbi:MAG: 30S ribosome-binding factor [Chlamydiales bacterium]|nr:30S ribosome-binding factor [Chlamydiales bacterium]MCH9620199.1 30S ribosome-binding factor [Chlamydiales bacterium]MCH9623086.1 30S ribosome-binding factor [Chlamydiales bacterium]
MISDVIHKEVKNPHLTQLITVTSVAVSNDLKHGKVFISVIGEKRENVIKILNKSAGFIAVTASKQVDIRYFPELTFFLDDSADKQMRIESVLSDIQKEQESRE